MFFLILHIFYKKEHCINKYLLKMEKILLSDELFSIAWSNELIDVNGERSQIFGAHFTSKFFLWQIKKNQKESKIDIK